MAANPSREKILRIGILNLASHLDPRTAQPAPAPSRTNQAMYGSEDPLSLIPFAKKVALCEQIDAAARARDPRVAQVSVNLAGSWSVVEIVRPDGFVAWRSPSGSGDPEGELTRALTAMLMRPLV